MSKILILTKVFLKAGLGESGNGSTKKKKLSKLSNTILFIVLFAIIGFSMVPMIDDVYKSLKAINQQGIILAMGFNIVSVAIFVIGMMTVISVFYFGKDIDILLSMPIKAHEITIAKLNTSIIYQYIIGAVFLLPILLVYGINEGASPMYWISAIIIFIILPVVPIVYSSIIAMILMSFTSLTKHKDGFKMIAGFLGVFVAIGINIVFSSVSTSSPEKVQQMILSGNNEMINQISIIFPASKLGTIALSTSSISKCLLNLAIIIILSLIAMIIFSLIANKLYFKGASGASESYGKREKIKGEKLERGLKQNSKINSYLKKEFIILFKTPTYLMNCISTIIILPIALLLPFLVKGNLNETVEGLRDVMVNPNTYIFVLIFALGFFTFCAALNPIAATSISREGQSFYVNKYIPIDYYLQLKAKLISSILINMITFFLIIIIGIYIGVPYKLAIAIFLMALEISIFTGALGIIIDLYSPKLNWEDEQKAVKQNFNYMKSGLISLILIIPLIFLLIKFELDITKSIAIILGVLIVLDIIFMKILKKYGVEKMASIED